MSHARARRLAPVLVLALTIAGCSDDSAAPPDAMLSPLCQEALDHSDLTWIQDNVFSISCAAFASCHQGGATAAQGLNLEAGNSEANMVNVPSKRFPDQIMIVPGNPEQSYLMVVLGSYNGVLSDRGTMPPNNPLLCVEKRDAIERWIRSLPPN